MSAVHLPNTATAEEVAEVIAADGVCIVDRLVDAPAPSSGHFDHTVGDHTVGTAMMLRAS